MDMRAQHTKETLRAALLACMEETPVKDIRAVEICERAGLNKTTFYKYYRDVDALIRELEQEQLEEFGALLREKKSFGEALLREILSSVDRAAALFHTENGRPFSESFRAGLISTALQYGVQAWKERIPKVEEHEAELVYEALLGGAFQAAMSENAKADREKVIYTIMAMFNSYIATHE